MTMRQRRSEDSISLKAIASPAALDLTNVSGSAAWDRSLTCGSRFAEAQGRTNPARASGARRVPNLRQLSGPYPAGQR